MKKTDSNPLQFVNIHGKPLGDAAALERAAKQARTEQGAGAATDTLTAAELERVLDALVLAGWRRGRTALAALLRGLGWRRDDGRAYSVEQTGIALGQLVKIGAILSHGEEGWAVPVAVSEPRLRHLLAQPAAKTYWRVWWWVADGAYGNPELALTQFPRALSLRNGNETVALMRLVLVAGIDLKTWNLLVNRSMYGVSDTDLIVRTLVLLQRLDLVELINRDLWWHLLTGLTQRGQLQLAPTLMDWLDKHVDQIPPIGATELRLHLAEQALQRGDHAGIETAVGRDANARAFLPLILALWPARVGRWADTIELFPSAWKQLCSHLGKRNGFAPHRLLQWYPLALMAQSDAKSWTIARKFCVNEARSRTPSPHDFWGRWVHALDVRLGDVRLQIDAFAAGRNVQNEITGDADRVADRVVLAAWLGQAPANWTEPVLQNLVAQLLKSGLPWKADLVMQACAHLGWQAPSLPLVAAVSPDASASAQGKQPAQSGFDVPASLPFFGQRREAWRDALAAITALGASANASTAKAQTSLQWRLTLDEAGRIHNLEAFEPPASARGKPKQLSMLQLKRRSNLEARDAAVARCLRTSDFRANDVSLNLAHAAVALLGHPALELADAPGVAVELVETLPVLEVRRERSKSKGAAEHFVFCLADPLLSDKPPKLSFHCSDYDDWDDEIELRDSLRIVRDSPERARLIRITAAHKRVAELIAQGWTVPVDAGAELDAALRVLAGHFVLHSDADAGEPVPSDARLVAQLQPRGDAMRLVLAVRPFGEFGPLLVPGQGRARLMTMHQGISLATERDLSTEHGHMDEVLQALPFLGDDPNGAAAADAGASASWILEDPEQVLLAVDTLGRLSAQAHALRALEWPKGRSLRVHAPPAQAFASNVKSGRDWFSVEGELRIDEKRVLSLQQLLGLLREGKGSRYVALGDGEYLALAEHLRQRLAELDAVGQADGDAIKLGATSAIWLADAAGALGLAGDTAWRKRAVQLEQASSLEPQVPHGLQAQLRPYQRDGFVWMSRLAGAGFGAILADDMGLGKTIQTLALLLQRSTLGPQLVVAPTSVCSNWVDEIARFAPALRCSNYGQAATSRAEQLQSAAAGDVLIVSYALLLRDAREFAAREGAWSTLVLDEAQALKNAATQRVAAVAALQADFRLALSGTPVENRLGDLWSIMNLVNPGLLGSTARFAERFGNPIERLRDEAARGRLRRLVSPFLLRRTKAQVLTDLPPRTEIVLRIEPHEAERSFLEAMRRQALERIAQLDPTDNTSRFNVLAELTRLRRAACDPRLAEPELGQIGSKVQAFERLAIELVEGRHQALVFSQFTDFLKMLAERLDAAGLRYQYLDGSTPAAQRGERIAAFQRGDADLFLISLKAGGFGLNLTAADYVIIADPWWNPAAEDQAMGRAHRIGQLRPVTVYRLVTAGSIEERIVSLHHDKRELAESLLSDQNVAAPLAADELIDLLRD